MALGQGRFFSECPPATIHDLVADSRANKIDPRHGRSYPSREDRSFTDRNGLVQHTQPWWDYWVQTTISGLSGEDVQERIPLEFIDALMAKAENEEREDREAPVAELES